MLRKTSFLFLTVLLSFNQISVSQTGNWPKTLLWRISGKDLKKPSYLFGTMHLQDKRLFNLGDSFYHHFEKAEGFAIEVDFNEYMDSILTKAFASVEDEEMRSDDKLKEGVKDVKIDIADSTAIPPVDDSPGAEMSKQSKKFLRKLRSERIKRLLVYGEMPTILDAYLYGMAMKQGKWLGAVEDVKDQLNLRDELGKDIDEEEEINQPDDKFLFTLENLIKIYLDQDLNGIEKYGLNKSSKRVKTIVFNNRNIKMANSMDSLSHQRSMFYAVGTAHLPGDSGVIRLLRNKGYTVTPVFSANKMAAEKYAANLPELTWYEISNADNLYSIEMPGIPKEYNLFGELVKMKVFVDITTMSFYMAGHTIAQYDDNKLEGAFKDMAKSMSRTGRVENLKKVDRAGIKAVEGITYGNGYYYRIQLIKKNNTAFFLMLGSQKRPAVLTSGANKFFNSFKAGAVSNEGIAKNWKEFGLPEKGFKVMMPAEPKLNKTFGKQAAGSGWHFTVYDCTDLSAGLYYLMQVRDIEAGRYLDGDSAYFESFRENLAGDIKETLKDEVSTLSSFPAFRYDALGKEDDIFYKTKNIVRGNRVYSLMVIGQQSKKDDGGPEQFFNSFQLTDYKKSDWKLYAAPDYTFTGWGSDRFALMKDEADNENKTVTDTTMVHYTSYNPNEVISYEVIKNFMPAYYWADSDSSFYESKINAYKQYDDSVLSHTKIKNGNLTGMEIIIQSPQNNNLTKLRVFLHADTLYTLLSFIPSQYIENPNHTKFFTDFRVKNDNIKTTVFTNKSDKLFEALQSKDSVTFTQAAEVFDKIEFKKTDLSVLHKALLASYPDDTLDYNSLRSKLVTTLDELSDSSTVDFVKKNYHSLSGEKENYKVKLLDVLANQQTGYSYSELKDLLINHTPKQTKYNNGISYQADDSLLLTKKLFPEILSLSRNSFMWQDVAGYAAELLDSGMIDVEILRPYEKDFIFHVDTLLGGRSVNEEDFRGWPFTDPVHLLGKLNSPASNAALQKVAAFKNLGLKQEAIERLLENSQPVNAKEMEKLAASNDYRLSFYEALKKINKISYYPAKYLTQRYFAEAELYNYGDEDYSPSTIELLGEREVVFDGKKQRFFLFRLGYKYDEEKEQEAYLGVAGPYSSDSKNIETNSDATNYYSDEEYDKKKVTKHFEELLKQGEEYIKSRKKLSEKNDVIK
jgi:uncharacterized protein YbaP (TraB family)